MKRNQFYQYFLLPGRILLVLKVWELWPLDFIQPLYGAESEGAISDQSWLYILSVSIFCAVFFCIAFIQSRKAGEKNATEQDSSDEDQKNSPAFLQENTVKMAAITQTPDDKKNIQVNSGERNKLINISLQNLIDSISDSIMVIDRNYQVRMLNKTARDIHFNGSHPSENLLCHKLSHDKNEPCSGPEHKCPFTEVMNTGKSYTVIHQHLDSQGNTTPFEILASPIYNETGDIIGIVELARDISDRVAKEKKQRETDARLLTLQREQSIATSAGGLAHEFNNILTSILGNAELLKIRLDGCDPNKELAESIITGSEHLADLTRQLLAYAKGGKYLNQSILVNAQINDSLRLIRTDKYPDIEVTLDLTEDLWPVLGDPAQLSQLIMNIIINAFEAMESQKGKLTVRTTNLVMNEPWECKGNDIHPPGYYVLISVTNTGSTISKELKEKIFEPFFSTKFTGRGMGLAAARGIVENHNGCISVHSHEGQTTFDIVLPREIPDREFMEDSKTNAVDVLDLSVLVIDDDPHVLSIIRSLLAHHGCKVISTDKGFEAIDIIEENRDKLDLVILDIQMPGMSGDKVYKRLKNITPGLKVLISSGHDEYTALKNVELDPRDRFIKKPFRMSDLMLKVKELMVNSSV